MTDFDREITIHVANVDPTRLRELYAVVADDKGQVEVHADTPALLDLGILQAVARVLIQRYEGA